MEFFQLTLDFMRHTSLFSTLSIKQCAKTASGSRTTSARKHCMLKKSPHEDLRYTCSNYSLQFLYYNFDARHIPTDFHMIYMHPVNDLARFLFAPMYQPLWKPLLTASGASGVTDAFEMVSRMNPFGSIIFWRMDMHHSSVGDVGLGSIGNFEKIYIYI